MVASFITQSHPPTWPERCGTWRSGVRHGRQAACLHTCNSIRFVQATPHQTCLCPVGEGEYSLRFSELGTRVAIVSSEPITRRSSDWVAVPRNTALIISQEKGGQLNILKAPIAAHGK